MSKEHMPTMSKQLCIYKTHPALQDKTFHFDFLRIFNTSTQKKKENEKIKSQRNLIYFLKKRIMSKP